MQTCLQGKLWVLLFTSGQCNAGLWLLPNSYRRKSNERRISCFFSWILLRNLHKPDVSQLNYWSITMFLITNKEFSSFAISRGSTRITTGKVIPVPKHHSINKYWANRKTSTHSRPRNWSEVSGQLHGPTALSPVKAVPVPTELEAVFAPKRIWTWWQRKKSLPFRGIKLWVLSPQPIPLLSSSLGLEAPVVYKIHVNTGLSTCETGRMAEDRKEN
jgi:hypothetical protein